MPLVGRGRPRSTNSDNYIDRDPQHLSVPMGGFAPVRQKRRSPKFIKLWRRNAATAVTVLGLIFAAGGAIVTTSQPPIPVYLLANEVHIGNNVLTNPPDNAGQAVPAMAYTGGAVLILVVNGDGSAKASAVTTVHGQQTTATCTMAAPTAQSITETCSFRVGTTDLTSTDVLDYHDSGHWSRAYSDGSKVNIGVPNVGASIPVPFAIGR